MLWVHVARLRCECSRWRSVARLFAASKALDNGRLNVDTRGGPDQKISKRLIIDAENHLAVYSVVVQEPSRKQEGGALVPVRAQLKTPNHALPSRTTSLIATARSTVGNLNGRGGNPAVAGTRGHVAPATRGRLR